MINPPFPPSFCSIASIDPTELRHSFLMISCSSPASLKPRARASGWDMEYTSTPTSVEFLVHTCPCFDGFLENGIEVKKINALCKATHNGMDKALKEVFPKAEFTSITKPSKEGDCIEKVSIPL